MRTDVMAKVGQVLRTWVDDKGKAWETALVVCSRCGGSGQYSYNQMDGTKCYGCMGSGLQRKDRRVLTEKEQASRDRAKAKAKAAKEVQQEANRVEHIRMAKERRIEKYGFANGIIYIVAARDTYEIHDELKAQGARYQPQTGWYFTEPTSSVATVTLTAAEALDADNQWVDNVEEIVRAKVAAVVPASQYQGEIDQKLTVTATYKRSHSYSTQFGTCCIYTFVDAQGNIYVWHTGSYVTCNEGDHVTLQGKVKDHTEYRGEQQTVLTRCKILVV